MKTIKSIYLIVFLLVTGAVFAENKKPGALVRSTLKGLEYRIKAGVNIGGTSPLPLPAEIREINRWHCYHKHRKRCMQRQAAMLPFLV